jgi:hypothetical protein
MCQQSHHGDPAAERGVQVGPVGLAVRVEADAGIAPACLPPAGPADLRAARAELVRLLPPVGERIGSAEGSP